MENQNQENGLVKLDSFSFLSKVQEAGTLQKKFQIYNRVLNQAPIIKHDMKSQMKKKGYNLPDKNNFEYIPIEVIEETLRQIFFGQCSFTIQSQSRELNSFIVVARIRYKNPVTNEFQEVDGIGAKAIQQEANSSLDCFNSTMKANGLEMAVSTAYSRAIKNAAKKLGRLFGADLNRDEELDGIHVYGKSIVDLQDQKDVINTKADMP